MRHTPDRYPSAPGNHPNGQPEGAWTAHLYSRVTTCRRGGPHVPDAVSVAVSEELFAPLPSGVEICYQTFGDPTGEPLLLVMGLGGPMTWWSPEFCEMLAERGFFV